MSTSHPTIRRILCPVDFSACSKVALDYAVGLGARLGASVSVQHVWEAPIYLTPEMILQTPGDGPSTLGDYVRARAGAAMDELLSSVNRDGVAVTGRIDSGPVVERILGAAAEHDLVVMGTHGRTGIARLLLGSVAEKVLRRAPCPVVTVRSDVAEDVDISEDDLP